MFWCVVKKYYENNLIDIMLYRPHSDENTKLKGKDASFVANIGLNQS